MRVADLAVMMVHAEHTSTHHGWRHADTGGRERRLRGHVFPTV